MHYLLSFLEGILTFVSPCLLPMLPIYLCYFAGGRKEQGGGSGRTLRCVFGFILGFTLVFVALGAFAAALGGLLVRYRTVWNLVCGGVVILFGLHYLGLLPVLDRLFQGRGGRQVRITGFLSSFLFGLVFSVSWTPCVGAFLGSALLLASQRGSMGQGIVMLLCYSAGLGVPFLLSSLLIDRLEGVLGAVKRHYRAVVRVSGCFLILTGLLMATGLLGRWLSLLAA